MTIFFRIICRFLIVPGFIGALLLTLIWALGFATFLVTVLTMQPQEPLIKTEGIVVLTGGSDRVRTGLELFRDGYAPYLLVSGVHKKTKLNDIFLESDVTIRPDMCCIDLGFNATDTIGNAQETAQWVHDRHLKTLRLVTANYHMPRAFFEMKRQVPDVSLYLYPVRTDRFQIWTKSGIILVLSEYHKTWVTLMRLFHERVVGRAEL